MTFINRTKEIKEIKKLLADTSRRATIVLGDGGIGKTRFLKRIEEIIKKSKNYKNCVVFFKIDFDEYLPQQTNDLLEYRLMKAMSNTNPEIFKMHERDFLKPKQSTYIGLINSIPARKVFLFDTVEKLHSIPLKRNLFDYLSKIDNAVFIFAGRKPEKPFIDEFDDFERRVQQVDPTYNLPILLEPFSDKNAETYINHRQKLLKSDISPYIKKKIINLAGGVPILIDLLIDYVVREIDINELLKNNSQGFKKELVQYITHLSTPLDIFILVLALVSPLKSESCSEILGIDLVEAADLIKGALSLSFVKELPDGYIKLHDEMQELVRKHIWQSDNIDIKPRSAFAENVLLKASLFFEKEDNRLYNERNKALEKMKEKLTWENQEFLRKIETEREIATLLWLSYGMDIKREDIWSKWNYLYNKIRGGRKFDLVDRMIDLIVRKPVWSIDGSSYIDFLTEDQRINYELKQAISYRDIGDISIAIKLLDGMLEKYGGDSSIRSSIFNQLGIAYRDLGKYREALRYQEECYEIMNKSREVNLLSMANVKNQIGIVYRLLEDEDEKSLQLAEENYLLAMKLLSDYKKTDKYKKSQNNESEKSFAVSSAAITTNLGYIESAKRKYDTAYDLYKQSMKILSQHSGREREIAQVETAMGIAKREEGRFQESRTLIESAIGKLHYPDDAKYLCSLCFQYGWTLWFQSEELGIDNPEGMSLLGLSKRMLEDALAYADKSDREIEKPGIYHQLAVVTWRLGRNFRNDKLMSDALAMNRKAIKLSNDLNNKRYLIDALTGEAEFLIDAVTSNVEFDLDILKASYTEFLINILGKAEFDLDILNAPYIEYLYQKILSYKDELPKFGDFYGRTQRIRGDFYFLVDRDYDSACKMYALALPFINVYSVHGPFDVREELARVYQNILTLEYSEANSFINKMKEYWIKNPVVFPEKRGVVDLTSWWDDKLRILKLQID